LVTLVVCDVGRRAKPNFVTHVDVNYVLPKSGFLNFEHHPRRPCISNEARVRTDTTVSVNRDYRFALIG